MPLRTPRREELRSPVARLVRRGEGDKADLWEVDLGDGAMVVKDFAGKSAPWRLLGRLQVRRELRAYRWLGGAAGVPRLVGAVDGLALALERVRGHQLAFAPDRFAAGERHMRGLREALDRLHAAGVAHLDLRGRENVLVRDDGEIVIVDLAGAVCLRPGGIAHRLLFPALASLDESAFLKWKRLLTPERLTAEDRAFERRFARLRALWPFNRKRALEEDAR